MGELIEHHVKTAGEFYVLRGELAEAALWGSEWSLTSPEYRAPGSEAFLESFELLGSDFIGDPADDFYQVIQFTVVYKRKVDGALFGAKRYESPGHDGWEGGNEGMNPYEALGVEWDWDNDEPEPLVLLPVRSFMRLGYEVIVP